MKTMRSNLALEGTPSGAPQFTRYTEPLEVHLDHPNVELSNADFRYRQRGMDSRSQIQT